MSFLLAAPAALNQLVVNVSTYIYVMTDDITDPFLPKDNRPPKGSEPVTNMFQVVTAWAIIIAMAVGLLWTLIALIMAAASKRHELKDAQTPALVFLVAAGFAVIVQVAWGVFQGVLAAA